MKRGPLWKRHGFFTRGGQTGCMRGCSRRRGFPLDVSRIDPEGGPHCVRQGLIQEEESLLMRQGFDP